MVMCNVLYMHIAQSMLEKKLDCMEKCEGMDDLSMVKLVLRIMEGNASKGRLLKVV